MSVLERLLVRSFAPRDLGRRGEARARWFYRLRGYTIVAKNVATGDGEIDLIARRGKTIVFVEVKTRQQSIAGAPWEAVDRRKQLQVARLAEAWIRANEPEAESFRFDVLSLVWSGWRFKVEHFENAFELHHDPQRPWKKK